MAKYTLKKLLVLIYFLEQAKQKRLIDHDPCLFRRLQIVFKIKLLYFNLILASVTNSLIYQGLGLQKLS